MTFGQRYNLALTTLHLACSIVDRYLSILHAPTVPQKSDRAVDAHGANIESVGMGANEAPPIKATAKVTAKAKAAAAAAAKRAAKAAAIAAAEAERRAQFRNNFESQPLEGVQLDLQVSGGLLTVACAAIWVSWF